MNIRRASLDDIAAIDHLRRKESDAVGFIPLGCYEAEVTGQRNGRLWIADENEDPVGFLFATFGRSVAHIQQVVVREDARRAERATALVEMAEAEALRRGLLQIGCRAADDLNAVDFWRALNFEHVGNVPGGSRRDRRISFFRKPLGIEYLPGMGRQNGARG